MSVLENPELANIQAAYLNVLDLLDDYPIRVRDMPSIDDVLLSDVESWRFSDLPRDDPTPTNDSPIWWLVDDAQSTVRFSDTDDAVYFDTENADPRRQLDIGAHQISLEDTSGIGEPSYRPGQKRPGEGSDEPPPKRPR